MTLGQACTGSSFPSTGMLCPGMSGRYQPLTSAYGWHLGGAPYKSVLHSTLHPWEEGRVTRLILQIMGLATVEDSSHYSLHAQLPASVCSFCIPPHASRLVDCRPLTSNILFFLLFIFYFFTLCYFDLGHLSDLIPSPLPLNVPSWLWLGAPGCPPTLPALRSPQDEHEGRRVGDAGHCCPQADQEDEGQHKAAAG